MQEETVISRRIADTWALARRLLDEYPRRAVFALHGDLGSGKTCFVQGLAAALDIRRPITSPTFIIMNEYPAGRRPLVHVDLYRLNTPDDALAIGFEEVMDSAGIVAVEWAERAGDLLPPDTIHLSFTIAGTSGARSITVRRPVPARIEQRPRRFA